MKALFPHDPSRVKSNVSRKSPRLLHAAVAAMALGFASPVQSQPLHFADDFEGPSLNPFWSISASAGAVVFPSTERVHSGSQSVKLTSTYNTGDKRITIYHRFAAPIYGRMSVWLYDTGADELSANYISVSISRVGAPWSWTLQTFDYDLGPDNGGHYYYAFDGLTPVATPIDRTKAWHQFSFEATTQALTLVIDGVTVYTGPGGEQFDNVVLSLSGPTWRPAWQVDFDDFEVQEIPASLTNAVPELQWTFGLGSTGQDYGMALTQDAEGNIYVAGFYSGTVDFDPGPGTNALTSGASPAIFAAKYTPRGALVWARSTSAAGITPGSIDGVRGIVLDPSGNVCVAGSYAGTVDFDPGPGTFNLTSRGGFDAFVWKLDSAGNFIWARSMGGPGTEDTYGLAVNAAGSLYVSGRFSGTADFDPGTGTSNLVSRGGPGDFDGFIAKLNSSGNLLWAQQVGGSGGTSGGLIGDSAYRIAVDGAGNVYVAGVYQGNAYFGPGAGTLLLTNLGFLDGFVLKLDGSGNLAWAKSIGGSSYDMAFAPAVDGTNGIFVLGQFVGTVDFDPGPGTQLVTSAGCYDVFLLKLNADGNFGWVKSFGASGCEGVAVLHLSPSGLLHVSGSFQGTVDFDPSPGLFNLTAVGDYDEYILAMDREGSFVWAASFGGAGGNGGTHDFVADQWENLYSVGLFDGTYDLDPGSGTSNLVSAGQLDVFVSKLSVPRDLALEVAASPEPVGLGSNLTYTITVTNRGPVTATGLEVTDALPTSASFVSVAASQGSCVQAAGIVTCALGTLATGATAQVTIVATPTALGLLTNVASVTGNEPDPNAANNVAAVGNTVYSPPVISAAPTNQTLSIGGNPTFCLEATGSAPVAYQWQFNRTDIPGATGSCLTLTNAGNAQAGEYSVVASNAYGVVTSKFVVSFLDLKMYAGLTIAGPIGLPYTVQYRDAFTPTNTWVTITTNLLLPVSPYLFIDLESPGKPQRFYQAFPTP